jgi:uncharacterized membrane protein YGL010W
MRTYFSQVKFLTIMITMNWLLDKYGESHKNATNKLLHWVCVPSIVFSLFAILYAIPFPIERGLFTNWAFVFYAVSLLYYLRLSIPMTAGLLIVCGAMLLGVDTIYNAVGKNASLLAYVALGIFVVAWIGQFIGHKIEGKKPSFLEDIQFLMVGPAWLLSFIYKKVGIKY